jgi:hypothetical protein
MSCIAPPQNPDFHVSKLGSRVDVVGRSALSRNPRPKIHKMGIWRLAAHIVAALVLVNARSSTGDEVLVVLEPGLKQADYSQFFGGLKGQSYLPLLLILVF